MKYAETMVSADYLRAVAELCRRADMGAAMIGALVEGARGQDRQFLAEARAAQRALESAAAIVEKAGPIW